MDGEFAIEEDLMHYLLHHPEAKDTAEGIMQWWLPRSYSGLGLTELTGALDRLVEKGRLNASMHAGTRVYGLDARHRDELLKRAKG